MGEFEQFSKALQDMAPAMDKYTMTSEEFVKRVQALGHAMQASWQQTGGDEVLWRARVDGPVYRQTPVLGRFRWYRRWRAWWLRRRLGM